MKKILTASLVAMMAVSAANADIASTGFVEKSIGALDGSAASTGTAAGKYVVTVSQTDGTVGSATVAFDKTVSENSTDNNAPTSKTVYNYVEGKLGALTTGEGSLGGRVSVLEGAVSAEGGLLDQVDALDKDKQDMLDGDNVKTSGSNTGVITAITATNGVVTATKAQIGTADIAASAGIKKTQLDSSVQTSLGKADSAVQSVKSGSANGTIDVDGTDVAVKGLGSAAYTASTAYATSAQGAKADSAVQSINSGKTNGTIDVDGTDVAVKGLGSAAYTASTAYATSAQGTKIDNIADATKLAAGQGDGTYTLTMSVSNNVATYKWEMIDRGN